MHKPTFFVFDLMAKMVCIGERIKKGTHRPCVLTIPCSTVTGALADCTGLNDIVAVGYFVNQRPLKKKMAVFSPQHSVAGTSKLPLTAEYLEDEHGKVFIMQNETVKAPDTIIQALPKADEQAHGVATFTMGALKSKGFGTCMLRSAGNLGERDLEIVQGSLKSRIYDDESYRNLFGITDVVKPICGYLWRPTSLYDGYYQRSLFEGSIVRGYRFLVEEAQDE